ncbi:tetratricopeptide repeat protein [Lutibacter sp.]|uniref:tetratricopeptide repeat protein n=1 Tax=Lutibacter sp. TaxID=1925666 RepID=UPI0025C2F5F9|nr:tetratricopeptide repeat protein [Lutibacter sp.]MCF6182648.1 tetratricopeptide repeat protein [Lutibacter sp.]
MKSNYLVIYILFLLGINIGGLFAQNTTLTEENNLKFQTSFFEALKQKAIENYPKAIENLENCYQLDSSNTAVQFELAKNYFLLKRNYEAAVFINKALYKKPNNVYLLQQKVAIFKADQNFKKAIKIQQKIIKIQPNLSNNLVLLYILNHNYNKAKKLIVEIENQALANTKTIGLSKYLKSKTQPNESNKNQVEVNSEDDNLIVNYNQTKNYKTLVKIINSYIKEEYFNQLNSLTKSELDLFPTQPFLYYANGLALTNLKKYNDAITVLEIGIDFVIDNPPLKSQFYDLLATCYTAINKPKEALKHKQKALNLRKE